MSHDLPADWYEEHDGQRLVLSSEKVKEAIDRQDATIRACNQKISELELWAKDYREHIAFWKAKADGGGWLRVSTAGRCEPADRGNQSIGNGVP